MKQLLIAVLLIGALSQSAVAQIKTAMVTGGEVQGVVSGELSIFKGIPFAAPPEGAMRWKAPGPVQPWSGIMKTNAFADACMQAPNSMGNTAPVSEDCLYLNVWTPAKKPGAKLPVLVWIYGGGFSGGSTSIPMYNGTGFAKQGLVFVSIAYRVGPFGFLADPELSRESGHGSGDYGLEDMIAGLKWVKKNIAQFGGDPDHVTIFGHSAGGMAVNMLAASPLARGLFQGVICMSGSSFAPLQTGKQAGTGLGIPTLKVAEAEGERFLHKLGVDNIKAARYLNAETIQKALAGGPGGIRFRPDADGYVIPGDLYSIYQARRFNDTPILIGNTSLELGAMMARRKITAAQFVRQVKSQYGPHARAILNVYPHATNAEARRSAMYLSRDSMFGWSTWTWARLQSRLGKGKAYEYYFNYHAPGAAGSGHGSDVPFAFQTLSTRRGKPLPDDAKLVHLISTYWANFAKTGNPNGPGLPKWPAFRMRRQRVMVFDAHPSARPVPNIKKLKAFDGYIRWLRKQDG